MKTPTLILLHTLLFTSAIAQDSCNGDLFNTYCCVNGHFTGPVYSSFEASISSRVSEQSASFSSRDASLHSSISSHLASISAAQDSLHQSLSSMFATRTLGSAPVITERAVLKRTVTTEVSPGLTCIGDSVFTVSGNGVVIINSDSTSTSGSSDAKSSSSSGSASKSTSTGATKSASTGAAPMLTQAPLLVAGAAAALAYGAM